MQKYNRITKERICKKNQNHRCLYSPVAGLFFYRVRLFLDFRASSDTTGKWFLTSAEPRSGQSYSTCWGVSGIVIWSILAATIGFAFGTLFAVSAPLVVDCFGIDNFGSIFGLVFTAFGFVSGALGTWLSGYLLDISPGNFLLVFIYLGSLMLISALIMKIVTPYSECTF